MILVEGIVYGGNLPLAERIVECIVDLAHGEAEARGRGAIDGYVGFEPVVLLIAVDLGQLWDRLQFGKYFWRPVKQFVGVIVLQRELVLRVRGTAADADVLHRL